MDVFALRDRVVNDYKRYIESFVRIRDDRIGQRVRPEFESGTLWPGPILQLNPAYEAGPTLDDLAKTDRFAGEKRESAIEPPKGRSMVSVASSD